MSKIITPGQDAFAPSSKSVKNAKFIAEPAVKVDTKKGKIAEERQARLAVAESKPDQEYLELFETVKGLIVTPDFWELIPDQNLQKVYGYVSAEMVKRGVKAPKLPEDVKTEGK
jgi:hypothetical protein